MHAGHQGAEKCKLRAKTCVFWHGIGRDIERLVESCHTCQQFQGKQPAESLRPHEIPVRLWQVLGTVLFHLDGTNLNYLLVADYYSKFPIVRQLSLGNYTSTAIVHKLQKIFISEHGILERVISDNGPN